ncbi:MAG: SDR family oxidoreductase [Candidatus Azambacteria bacterium]|nr:SDR family oxidoreductase [Candidatus Azambacteria bacterium]
MDLDALKIFSMEGKVVIITGGAGFLGMQYAKALSKAGAKVVLWDKNDHIVLSYVDVTSESSVRKATERVLKGEGRIDVLINNAGMNPAVGSDEAKQMFAPYEEYPIDLWKKEIDVDLTGMMICTQAVAKQMMKQGSGVIVNIASEVANIAVDNRIYGEGKFKSIAYIVAKSGILGLTRAWASYLGKYGVRVNAFSPGGMPKAEVPKDFKERYSSLNMLGRMAEVNEYNGAMLFLCSDASSFMTGTQLVMDGGKSAW